MIKKTNTLQAVLDRVTISDKIRQNPISESDIPSRKPTSDSRKGTKLIGGHFPPNVSTQLRIIAAEEGVTVQSLLGEALDDLFVKKGRNKIINRFE